MWTGQLFELLHSTTCLTLLVSHQCGSRCYVVCLHDHISKLPSLMIGKDSDCRQLAVQQIAWPLAWEAVEILVEIVIGSEQLQVFCFSFQETPI